MAHSEELALVSGGTGSFGNFNVPYMPDFGVLGDSALPLLPDFR